MAIVRSYNASKSTYTHPTSETHLPKTFRLDYTWSRSDKAKMQRNTGFCVPDDDDVDRVSVDESSDDEIEITKSRPRHYSNTFSVPSSDDEGFESSDIDEKAVAESVSDEVEEVSAPTTPESKVSANGDKDNSPEHSMEKPSDHESLFQGLTEGSSQQNPIDLDDAPTKVRQIDDTDSEVEEKVGPEVYPTVPHKHSPPPRPKGPLATSLKAGNLYLNNALKNSVPETQAKDEGSTKRTQVDTYYESLEEDYDEEEANYKESGAALLDNPLLPRANDYPTVPEAPHIPNAALPQVTEGQVAPVIPFPPTVQESELLDVSRVAVKEPSHKRAPSPSDAALARKALGMNTRKNTVNDQESTAYIPYDHGIYPPGYGNKPLGPPYYSASWNYYPADSLPCQYNSSSSYDWNRSKPTQAPMSDRLPFGIVDITVDSPRSSTEDNRQTQASCHNLTDRWNQRKQEPESAYPITQSYNQASVKSDHQNKQSGETRHVIPEVQAEQETSRKQTSRLDISNLVNEVQLTSQQRSRKRKADEVSSDDEEPHIKAPELTSPNGSSASATDDLPTASSQETQLPDAQRRDALTIPPSTLQSQMESPNSLTVSSVTSASAKASKVEEPARKKIKTTSSSSRFGGVAKFVSGVAVGVVGVVAAIIATAPASVQEEVLREVTMQ